jgi:hypothetical protein
MINDENTTKEQLSDPSPDVESDHVEAAPSANNPTATAGPSDSFCKHLVRIQQLNLELARKEADNIRRQGTFGKKAIWV